MEQVVVRRWDHKLPDECVEVPDGQGYPAEPQDMGDQEGRGAGDVGAAAAPEEGGAHHVEAPKRGVRRLFSRSWTVS